LIKKNCILFYEIFDIVRLIVDLKAFKAKLPKCLKILVLFHSKNILSEEVVCDIEKLVVE
jgi:hypothetical protein